VVQNSRITWSPNKAPLSGRLRTKCSWPGAFSPLAKKAIPPKISSLFCRFVLREAVFQTKYRCSLKTKHSASPQILDCHCLFPKRFNSPSRFATRCVNSCHKKSYNYHGIVFWVLQYRLVSYIRCVVSAFIMTLILWQVTSCLRFALCFIVAPSGVREFSDHLWLSTPSNDYAYRPLNVSARSMITYPFRTGVPNLWYAYTTSGRRRPSRWYASNFFHKNLYLQLCSLRIGFWF